MTASYFCIQPSDWPLGLYASIQVKLYVYKATKYYRNRVLKKFSGLVDSCFALTVLALKIQLQKQSCFIAIYIRRLCRLALIRE